MLNPLEYDLEELRAVAGVEADVGDDAPGEEPERLARPLPAADLVSWARQHRELATSGGRPDGDALPLSSVPDCPGSVMLALEWLDGLVHRAGVHGALAALDYYADVGWLSRDAELELRDYLRGLDAPGGRGSGLDALDARDHRQSLLYVTRIASGDAGAADGAPDGPPTGTADGRRTETVDGRT